MPEKILSNRKETTGEVEVEKSKERPEESSSFSHLSITREVAEWVSDLVKGFGDDETKNASQVQFKSEFRDQYIDFRAKLAILVEKVGFYLSYYSDMEGFEEFVAGYRPNELSDEFWQQIRLRVEIYIEDKRRAEKLVKEYSGKEIFKSLTGKNPQGVLWIERHQNIIILMTLDSRDFSSLYCNKDNQSSDGIAGFHSANRHFVLKKKNKLKVDEELPIIVLNINEEREDDVRNYMSDLVNYLENCWHDTEEEYWMEESGMDQEDEDYSDDANEAMDQWVKNEISQAGGELMMLVNGDDDLYAHLEISEVVVGVANTLKHEIQHGRNWNINLENWLLAETAVDSPQGIKETFKWLYKDYLNDLADEVLASNVGGHSFLVNKGTTSVLWESDYFDNTMTPEERDLKDEKTKELYWYPQDDKVRILGIIRRKIGKEKYDDWEVAKMWDEVIEKKLEKAMHEFSEIGQFISRDRNLFQLFQVEPGEGWLRLYRWLRADPELANRAIERVNKGVLGEL